jgi:hypothetical protein
VNYFPELTRPLNETEARELMFPQLVRIYGDAAQEVLDGEKGRRMMRMSMGGEEWEVGRRLRQVCTQNGSNGS